MTIIVDFINLIANNPIQTILSGMLMYFVHSSYRRYSALSERLHDIILAHLELELQGLEEVETNEE